MFTIDLLKGKGIPPKSRPGGAVLIGLTFAVPIVITIVMLGSYLSGRITAPMQRGFIDGYEAKISKLAEDLALQKEAERKMADLNTCLREVADVINNHVQWSGILQLLAENIPEGLVLEKLSVKANSVSKKIPIKDTPGKYTTIYVPRWIMQISLYTELQADSDEVVLQFQGNLRDSNMLSPRGVNILDDEKEGRRYYDIQCIVEKEETAGGL